MNKNLLEQEELDLTQPRLAAYKQAWRVSQDAVYWVDICRAQRMRSQFFQTRSHEIILCDTLPPICIEKVVSRETEEVLFYPNFEVATSCTDDYLIGKKIGILMHQFTMRRQRESVQGLSEVVVVRGRCNEVCVFLCAQSSALRSSWCCEVAVSWRES